METNNVSRPSFSASETAWPLQRVGLRVRDIKRSVDYYTQLGFSIVNDARETGGGVGLGVGTREVLHLRPFPEGKPRPARTAGLYHFALLLADEVELGSFLQHCAEQHIPVAGSSDHLVSQALYLNDPEGNGIEVYADRSHEQWQYNKDGVVMDVLPLNIPALLNQAERFPGFSSHLRLGHMHLNVGNLERSMAFYKEIGMELMTNFAGQADFLSWQGYHHHLGINLWAGRNVSPVTAEVCGLDFFELQRPGLSATTMRDPDGVTVVVL